MSDTDREMHTVVLHVHVRSETPEIAKQKVLAHFPAHSWPPGSVEVRRVAKGWRP